jgi:histidinol phosphatase-like enzyme
VLETLKTLKELGCLIVGYTESQAYYTEFRVKALGLDGIIDYLYSPQNHEMPQNLTAEQTAFYPIKSCKLEYTQHHHTPKGEIKPNPDILRSILTDINAPVEEVAYIGDSLTKDIIMAQAVPVLDVYAQYGASHKRQEYELLRKVTHWKPEQVEKEKLTDQTTVVPTFVLQTSYSEILTLFQFIPYVGIGAKVRDSQIPYYLEIWKKTVDVQQHFNDLELRIRNLAVTVLGAVLSGAAFSLKENIQVVLYGRSIPVAMLLILAGLITWGAFYFMDRHWYHRLLRGAVKHGEAIEKRLATTLPQLALTQSISEASPTVIWGKKIHSSTKMNGFYAIGAVLLIVFSLVLFFGNPSKPREPSATSSTGTMKKEPNHPEPSPQPAIEKPQTSE